MTARSYLFVPGDREEMLRKASSRGADALIIDLEDGVAPSQRSTARTTTASWLGGAPAGETWVRIDPDAVHSDIEAVAVAWLAGIVVPKVRTALDVERTARLLGAVEEELGTPPGSIGLLPMVETAAALTNLHAIAGAERVRRLMIGEMDLGAELGIDHDDSDVWLPIRLEVVVASAAAGLPGPIGPVPRDFTDLVALRATTETLRRTGFAARAAIHPAQIAVINECFTPSQAELEAAARLVERFDADLAAGRGAAVDEFGHMVDEAAVRRARDLLNRQQPAS